MIIKEINLLYFKVDFEIDIFYSQVKIEFKSKLAYTIKCHKYARKYY